MAEEEKYFIISRCDDAPSLQVLTREELLKYLEEIVDEEIDTNYIKDVSVIDPEDLMYFPSRSILIIKGRVVEPTVVKVIKKLEIE